MKNKYVFKKIDPYSVCPICHKNYFEPPALSRKDNKTEICPNCGIKEALEILIKNKY